MTTDVVVIGAGPAGLSAALRAAELGLGVCLFEKMNYPYYFNKSETGFGKGQTYLNFLKEVSHEN